MNGFPTNRYILENLVLAERTAELEAEQEQNVPLLPGNETSDTRVCDVHDQPCVFFCSRVQCRTWLCAQCPIQNHSNHNLVGLNQERATPENTDARNIDGGNEEDDRDQYFLIEIAEVHMGEGVESDPGNDTISQTGIDMAISIGDSIARSAQDETASVTADDVAGDAREEVALNVEDSGTRVEPNAPRPDDIDDVTDTFVAQNEIVREEVDDVEQHTNDDNQRTETLRKHTNKCKGFLSTVGNVLACILGVLAVLCIGPIVAVGIVVVYVVYLVGFIFYHIGDGMCNICTANKECCYCIGDTRERFSRCKDRIESFLTICKNSLAICFGKCGGCNERFLSVIYSMVLYFVVGVVALFGIIFTGAILVAGVILVMVFVLVACTSRKILEK